MKRFWTARVFFSIFVCAAVLFSGCVSTENDPRKSSPQELLEAELTRLERLIVPLEAMGGDEARGRQAELSAARNLIAEMKKNADAGVVFAGKLAAWSGRLVLLEGGYSEARQLYRQTLLASPWNTALAILGIRLERDAAKRLELVGRELVLASPHSPASGFGELHVEEALALLELRRFDEAVDAFDTAFALENLDSVYRNSYQAARDRARELGDADGVAE